MIAALLKMFGIGQRREAHNEYLRAMLWAQHQELFKTYEFNPATRAINPETAKYDELLRALDDCKRCIGTEYPETEEGTIWAIAMSSKIRETIKQRRETCKHPNDEGNGMSYPGCGETRWYCPDCGSEE